MVDDKKQQAMYNACVHVNEGIHAGQPVGWSQQYGTSPRLTKWCYYSVSNVLLFATQFLKVPGPRP